jgi:hypothetical protein
MVFYAFDNQNNQRQPSIRASPTRAATSAAVPTQLCRTLVFDRHGRLNNITIKYFQGSDHPVAF